MSAEIPTQLSSQILCLLAILLCLVIHTESYIYVYPPTGTNLTRQEFDDTEALFGHTVPGIEGWLNEVTPRNACTPIIPANPHKLVWFALIEESTSQELCTYSMQVQHAQSAGYTVAIVYNHSGEKRKRMGGTGPSIMALYIGYSDAQELKKYNYKTASTVYITRNVQIPIQFYLVPFAVVVGICFLFMLLFSAIRFIRYRRRINRNRLSKSNLRRIPTQKFKKGDDYDICAICLDDFEEGDKLRLLPCTHVYHCKCVDPWLTAGKKVCPVCKRSVEPDKKKKKGLFGGDDEEEAQSSSRELNDELHSDDDEYTGPNRSTASGHNPADDSSDAESDNENHNETTPLLSNTSRQPPSAGSFRTNSPSNLAMTV